MRISRLLAAALLALPGIATAQDRIPDAWTVPSGLLMIGFQPIYTNYDQRISDGSGTVPKGDPEPLGNDLSSDVAGSNIFPTIMPVDQAVRDLTGVSDYRASMGSFDTQLDADRRIFPLDLAFGLTSRLTVWGRLPIVTARMNATVLVDSTDANVGWNQVSSQGTVDALVQLETLQTELAGSGTTIRDGIANGDYGCPTSPSCNQALVLADRIEQLVPALTMLTGVAPDGPADVLPPVSPLADSPEGLTIIQEIDDIATELQALGLSEPTGQLVLPTQPLSSDDLRALILSPEFGYEAFPLETNKLTRLGDAEVGLRFLMTDGTVRSLIFGTVRLPTGTRESPLQFADIGTGDKQTDLIGGAELVLNATGIIGAAVAGSYTYQMSDQVRTRVTSPFNPIVPSADIYTVNRDLGDMFTVSGHPWVRLSREVRAYLTASYFKKMGDSYSEIAPITTTTGATVSDLANGSSMEALSFGGGLAYYSTRGGREDGMPIEAGLSYRSVMAGSGGLTPVSNTISIYLRLYAGF